MSKANSLNRLPIGNDLAAATLSLKYAAVSFGLAALIALALYGAPAAAEDRARAQSVEIYGGELFGDNLTDAPVSGRTPRLNDNATFGARYNYNFTDMWGIQLSGGYSPNRAARVPSGKDNLGLTTVDLDAVWNITPHYPIIGYVLAGAGYAWANLDTPIVGEINGRPLVLRESNGFTANVGIGAKYYAINNLYVKVDAGYRFLNRLVSDSNQNLNTAETTLGIGWQF
jgi:opacity protein-like surface antigen